MVSLEVYCDALLDNGFLRRIVDSYDFDIYFGSTQGKFRAFIR